MENTKKYKHIKLVSSVDEARRYINKCQYKSFTIVTQDLVCLDLIKREVKLDKPIYTGMVSNFKNWFTCIKLNIII